ncbi:hypothetical protein AUK22_06525 [bacterium CG2_30_54_10]|nr:MAG: hypothetical protein AUK22_06525 [bacterium CG2_30_54_10]
MNFIGPSFSLFPFPFSGFLCVFCACSVRSLPSGGPVRFGKFFCFASSFPSWNDGQFVIISWKMVIEWYLLNNSGRPGSSWRKRFFPSVEITALFVIPNDRGESGFVRKSSPFTYFGRGCIEC